MDRLRMGEDRIRRLVPVTFVRLMTAVGLLMLVLGALPAMASGPEPLVVELDTTIGTGVGTWEASGAFEDEGTFEFLTAQFSPLFGPRPNRAAQITIGFTGASGTFTARLSTLIWYAPGCNWIDQGRWVIQSGTGAYENLQGTGWHSADFDVCIGSAPAVWEGSAHFTG